MHISVAAEPIFEFFGFPITNSLLATWIVILILSLIAFLGTVNLRLVPGGLQNFLEVVVEGLMSFFHSIIGEKAEKLFPLLATFLIYILFLNWFGLLPGIGSIGFRVEEHGKEMFIPLLRGGTADLNTTLALALVSVLATQYFSIKYLGIKGFIKRFISKNPVYTFVGLLEVISELSKIMSFSFRLFGNIFAGEVLLTVILFLVPFLAPIPFLGLEIFVGLIQALVFTMLTVVFISNSVVSHDAHSDNKQVAIHSGNIT